MTGTPTRLAVFGRPVAHSRSPDIHAMFAAQAGIMLNYERVLVPEGEFSRLATEFLQTGTGFNITLPCKHEAYRFASEKSLSAHNALAVNTISIDGAGVIRGDNTDGQGLVRDLTHNLGWQIQGCKLLVLGAGGAVSGVLADLLGEEPLAIHLHNRTHEKAQALVARIGDERLSALCLDELESGYDLVINGTSMGLPGAPEGQMNLPPGIVVDGSCCYDMVYGRKATLFNRWCMQQAACVTADGLGMLVEQAALAFDIWFNRRVQTRPVLHALREALTSS